MKRIILSTLFLFACLSSPGLADDKARELPQFEKLLPSEHFFNKGPLPVGHTYGFATNKSLKELEKLLLKALGDGWKFETAPPEVVKDMSKAHDFLLVGVGTLTHPDFEKYSIGVTLANMPKDKSPEFKDYTGMLSIVTVDLEIAMKLEEAKKQKGKKKETDPDPGAKPGKG